MYLFSFKEKLIGKKNKQKLTIGKNEIIQKYKKMSAKLFRLLIFRIEKLLLSIIPMKKHRKYFIKK